MKARMFIGALALVLVVVAFGPVSAGGPVCKVPPMCGPPPMCAPPACGPQPYCCPPPCPPPCCGPNPIGRVFSGAFRLVTGVVALPFRVVDRMIDALDCNPCGPKPMCCPPPSCCPPPCPPPVCGPVKCCPPPACGPAACCPPPCYGMAPGMGPAYGRGHRRMMSPMSKKMNSSVPSTLMASPNAGIFRNFW
ncbi:MAG: hypothetical protein ACP5U1_11790 [Desulfomonilaceae bacterium]